MNGLAIFRYHLPQLLVIFQVAPSEDEPLVFRRHSQTLLNQLSELQYGDLAGEEKETSGLASIVQTLLSKVFMFTFRLASMSFYALMRALHYLKESP